MHQHEGVANPGPRYCNSQRSGRRVLSRYFFPDFELARGLVPPLDRSLLRLRDLSATRGSLELLRVRSLLPLRVFSLVRSLLLTRSLLLARSLLPARSLLLLRSLLRDRSGFTAVCYGYGWVEQ